MIKRTLLLAFVGGVIIGLLPVEAGDTAPGQMVTLVPQEWQRSAVMGEMPPCTDLGDCCGIDRACGGFATGPLPPAPVPLNGTGLFALSALVALSAVRLNMKGRYK